MRGGETRRGSRGRKAALGRDNPVLFSLSLGLDHQQLLLDEQLVKEQLVEEYLVNDLLEHQQRKVLVEDE